MVRNDGKAKSGRKPLRELSNQPLKSSESSHKKTTNAKDCRDEDPMDRLLLVHSDISSLLNQIDQLVAQAVEVTSTNKKGREEVESFTNVLSEINSSLKPWMPRFQKALSCSTPEPKNQQKQPVISESVIEVMKDVGHDVESPDSSEMDSLVSPSPLVTWRATDCIMEMGKQLFLLTPLPRAQKSLCKSQALPKTVASERISSSIIAGTPSVCANTCAANIGKFDPVFGKPISQNCFDDVCNKLDTTLDFGLASSPKPSKTDHSMALMTPCLKRSPPKSCILLEPSYELSNRNGGRYRNPTPFPAADQRINDSSDSESSGPETSLKYTQLSGLKALSVFGDRRKVLEASPGWFMSPPKTCTLMDPSDRKSLKDAPLTSHTEAALNQQLQAAPADQNDVQCMGHLNMTANAGNWHGRFAPAETPLCKDPQSTVHKGKPPGEQTLKRELWAKFEAALTHTPSLFQGTSQKGFLDRLEEATCEGHDMVLQLMLVL